MRPATASPFTTALFAMDSANNIFQNVFAAGGGFGRFDDDLSWPAYDATDRRVLRFGHRIAAVRDGGGQRWL